MFHPEKARVVRELKKLSKPGGTFDASRYFRGAGDLGFYDVGTTAMRALARSIHAEHRHEWSIDDAMAFADALVVDRYLEVKSIGIEVVARYRRDFTPRRRGNGGSRAITPPTGPRPMPSVERSSVR